MVGVILCGGQSSRMGTDKGLLMGQSASWAQTAATKMAVLGLPVAVSVNKAQYNNYANIFTPAQLVKDDDSIDVKGPLLGILSVHQQYPAADLFVLACDMPLMEAAIMQTLLSLYDQQRADAFVFANEQNYEPLCAIYTAKGLATLHQLQKNGGLTKYSMQFVLTCIDTVPLPITPYQQKYFLNVNSPSALSRL